MPMNTSLLFTSSQPTRSTKKFCFSDFHFSKCCSSVNSGSKRLESSRDSSPIAWFWMVWMNWATGMGSGQAVRAMSAAPWAGTTRMSGTFTQSFSVSCRFSRNTCFSFGRNANGPPQKNTGASTSTPRDSVPNTCRHTAWNTDSATSALLTLRASRFWMSVLENTPQRDAIG